MGEIFNRDRKYSTTSFNEGGSKEKQQSRSAVGFYCFMRFMGCKPSLICRHLCLQCAKLPVGAVYVGVFTDSSPHAPARGSRPVLACQFLASIRQLASL